MITKREPKHIWAFSYLATHIETRDTFAQILRKKGGNLAYLSLSIEYKENIHLEKVLAISFNQSLAQLSFYFTGIPKIDNNIVIECINLK